MLSRDTLLHCHPFPIYSHKLFTGCLLWIRYGRSSSQQEKDESTTDSAGANGGHLVVLAVVGVVVVAVVALVDQIETEQLVNYVVSVHALF